MLSSREDVVCSAPRSGMHPVIAETYPKTTDAVLVDKWFGMELKNNFTTKLLLTQFKDEYLAEAQAREDKAKKFAEAHGG